MKTNFTNKKMMMGLYFLFITLFNNVIIAQVIVPFNTAGTFTWTCPVGVTTIQVECWGAGGGGGAANTIASRAGGGGGGGSYVVNNTVTVVPGTIYNIIVGAGGTTPSTSAVTSFGLPGGKSEFSGGAVTTITASGGTGGGGANSATTSGSGGKLGGVYGFSITAAGVASYSGSNTTITVTGGGGSGTTAAVATSSSIISNISTINQGTGYATMPTVAITTTGTGSGATASALFNPNINAGGTVTFGADGSNGILATSGGAGGAGGNGGAGGATNTTATGSVGAIGSAPGGGGAGGYNGSTAVSSKGGVGGAGKVTITYTAPTNTLFYYKGTGALNDITSWGLNANGTGTSPINFTDDLQSFNINNTSAVSTSAPWTVSGSNSKIIVGNSSLPPVTFTIAASNFVKGQIDIPSASSGSNSVIVKDTVPTFGILDLNSEVHFQGRTTITNAFTFGKLYIDGAITDTVTFSAPGTVVKTSLYVAPTGFMSASATTANYINASGATVLIDGYLRTQRPAGIISSNVTPQGITSQGVLQFSEATPNINLGSNSTVEFARGSSATVQTITPRSDYANLTISGLDNNKVLSAATTVSKLLTLNITGSSTFTGAANITLSTNASIVLKTGSLDAAPIFGSSIDIIYNGTTVQTTGPELPTATTILKNLTIDNAAGVILNAPATTKGILTLTNGIVTTTSANLLTLAETATITGGSNASHINGPLAIKTAAIGDRVFPVGKAGLYRPVSVFPSTATASEYKAEYFNTGYGTYTLDPTTPLSGVDNTQYWDVNKITGSKATVSLSLPGLYSGTLTPTGAELLGVAHFVGGQWKGEGGVAIPNASTATNGVTTAVDLNAFSPFTFGTTLTTLSLKLISFSATLVSNNVSIKFSTINERNVSHFEIEESTNGINFYKVGTLNATNTNGTKNYQLSLIAPTLPNTYYRLKTINQNGSIDYSSVILLKLNSISITIFPNPVSNVLNITGIKSASNINLFNAAGKKVKQIQVDASSSAINLYNLKAGTYLINITNANNEVYNKTFIKK